MPSPRQILIIDGSPSERSAIRGMLEDARENWIVQEAAGDAEGLAWCRSEQPDCVIIAHSPPDAYGIAAARELNPDPLKPRIAVLIVTTERGEALAVKALKNGAQDLLVKGSFTAEELHKAIGEAIETVASYSTQKQKVENTADGEDHLRRVLDSLYIFVGVLTPDGVMVQCNSTPIKAAGQTREDVIGTHFAESFWWNYSEESNRRIRADIERAARGEHIRYDAPVRVRDERGEPRFIEVDFALTPMFDDRGRVTHLIPIGVDISDRKDAERRLKESEDRFQLAFAAVQSVIYDWNIADDTITRSAELVNLLGFDNSEPGVAHNKWWLSRLHPDDVGRSSKLIKDAIESGADRFEDEYRMLHKNGNYVWVRDSGVFLKGGNGKAIRCVGSVRNVEGRKAVEQSLKISEERLNLAMQGANIGAFDWNIKTGEIQWSIETEESAAMSANEFDNSFDGFVKLVHPLDRDRLRKSIDAAFQNGDYECEFRMLRGDGSIRWVIGKGRVFFDDDGEPTRLVGVDIDITKRKQAEEALAESQRFTKSIVETAPSVLYLYDLESNRNTYLTEQAARVLGYSTNELDRAAADFIGTHMHPDDRKRAENHFNTVKQGPNGETFEFEYRMRHKSGEWRWFRSRDKVFRRDENGRACEILGIAADITERKQAEEVLHQSRERLAATYTNAPIGIVETDLDGNYLSVNDEFCRITSYARDELLELNLKDVTHPDDYPHNHSLFDRMAAGEFPSYRLEKRFVRKDGSIVWGDVNRTLIRDPLGKPQYVVGTIADVTERRRAEEQLRDSERFVRSTLDCLTPAVAIIDREGFIVDVNETWTEFAKTNGYKNSKHGLGENYLDIVRQAVASGEKGAQPILDGIEAVLNGTQAKLEFEYPCHSPDEQRWFLMHVSPLATDRGGAVISHTNITGRKLAEEALLASERRFRGIFNYQFQFSALLTPDGKIVQISESALQNAGIPPAEVVGKAFLDMVWWRDVPETREIWRVQFAEALEKNVSSRAEAPYVFPDGSLRYAINTATVLRDGNGDPEFLLVEGVDITERKEAEENLRRSQENLARAQSVGQMGWWNLDTRQNVLHWSDETYHIFGLKPGTPLTYETFLSCLHPADREYVDAQWQAALQGEPYDIEHRITVGEKIKWIREKAFLEFDENRNLLGGFGIAQDITERREAEERIRRSEELFRTLAKSSPVGIFRTDTNGKCTYVNEWWMRVSGLTFEESLGDGWTKGLHPDDRDSVSAEWVKAAQHNLPFASDYRFINKDGKEYWVTGRAVAEMDADGAVTGFVGTIADITKRKRDEENLAFLADLQAEFAPLLSPDEIMRVAGRRIADYLNLTHCLFVEIDQKAETAAVAYDERPPDAADLAGRYQLKDFHLAKEREKLASGQTIAINNVRDKRRSKKAAERFESLGIRSLVTAPFIGETGWKFALSAQCDRPHTWRDDECELLQELAARIYLRIDRARAEEALRASEEFNRTMLEASPDCVKLLDADGHLLYMNVNGMCIMEIDDFEPLRGKQWCDFWSDDARPKINGAIKRARRGKSTHFQEFCPTAKGTPKWWDVIVSPISSGDGKPVSLLAVSRDITESKEAEERIRAAHDTFRHLVENSPFGIYVVDSDFRVAQVGAGARKTFNNIDPLIGRDFGEVMRILWDEPFAGEAVRRFRHTLETGEPYHQPSMVEVRSDIGETEAYDWKIERITMPDGRFGVVCHFYDLSERMRFAAAMRESEERFRLASDATAALVYDVDLTGKREVIAHGLERVTGYTNEESDLSSRWWHSLIHPDDLPAHLDNYRKHLEVGGAYKAEYRILRKNGESIWVEDTAQIVKDATGANSQLIGTIVDIDVRKRSDDKLRSMNYRFRVAEEAAKGFNYEWNLETGVVTRSEAVERVIGRPREQLEKTWQAWADLIHPGDLPVKTEADAREFLEKFQDESFSGEYRVRHRDGHYLWVMERGIIVRNADGKPTRVVGQTMDITERKDAEESLRQRELLENLVKFQEAERHRVARDIHDHLGQQLTGLRLALEDLRESSSSDPSILEKVEKTQEVALRLDKDASRLAFELRSNILVDLGLSKALEGFVSEWSRNYGIHAEFHAVGTSERFTADLETHLYRVGQEALNNTVKHARANRVDVILEVVNDEVRLIVEDDGVGFNTEKKTAARPQDGHGLGLLGMKERVELLAGTLEIDSTPGQGTTLFITVPARFKQTARTVSG